MPNSPTNLDERSGAERRRICDFCIEATALLFCRADAAKLCLACDKEVHATAQLFTKHTRRLLCDACDSAPAVIVCSTHRFVLCQNCDFEIHNCGVSLTGSSHDRRPLEGFSGQPTASEITTFLGLQGIDCTKSFGLEGDGLVREVERQVGVWGDFSDFSIWDQVSPHGVVSVDELIDPGGENHGFQAMVPLDTLPKDRNSTCGQHKHEMIRQLCKLAKSETDLNGEFQTDFGYQTEGYGNLIGALDFYEDYQHEYVPVDRNAQEATLYLQDSKDEEAINEAFLSDIFLGGNTEEVSLCSDRSADVGNDRSSVAMNGSQSTAHIPSKTPTLEVNNADRGSALTRYKEKKRSRRYEKHIRYESRKALAETRIRVKGRFAKVIQSNQSRS